MVQKLVEIFQFLVANGPDIVTAVIALLTGAIAVALWLPGPQPEAALQKVVDFLSKYSRKAPKEEA